MESCPLDEPFAQATLVPKTPLDPSHRAGVALVIVAEKVQEAVQREHSQFRLLRMSRQGRLLARDTAKGEEPESGAELFGRRQRSPRSLLQPQFLSREGL